MWYFTSLLPPERARLQLRFEAGLGQTPAAVVFAVVARRAAALLPRIGARALVAAGCGGLVAGFGWLAQADAGAGYGTAVLGPTLLIAIGIGLTFPTLMAVATAEVADADAGIVAGWPTPPSRSAGR